MQLDLESEILRLKKERNAVVLAHYYQEGDIQERRGLPRGQSPAVAGGGAHRRPTSSASRVCTSHGGDGEDPEPGQGRRPSPTSKRGAPSRAAARADKFKGVEGIGTRARSP